MRTSMKLSDTLKEVETLRRRLALCADTSSRDSVSNQLFNRINTLWREGAMSRSECWEIYSEIQAATHFEDTSRVPMLALRTYES
ncbi:hypothetical protein [Tahibacter amnicola]|uniref:Uncharacterized protein n=1 Tax=Tahibacter amnicola TaxID=2976241 RepID=A0ABY6BEQ3_9GAMM|nr:hypothetical protein [Tahibacter amnicola]MCU7376317.1 hypothetical protein [Paucibacter sp. O1-1]MDA3831329.1 hypothetical protein [Paucibacter sp. O1-1]UXI68280.1 hypothetical protein N4264_01130 [Tahibacter amnicola]